MRKGRLEQWEKDLIYNMRNDNKGYIEISKRLNCKKDRVKDYCRANGLGGFRAKDLDPENAYDNFIKNFNTTYGDRYLYIGGYTHSDNDVIIECKTCHTQMSRNLRSMRKEDYLYCEGCLKEQRDRESLIRILNKRISTLTREIKLKEQEEQRQRDLITICQECGKVFKADRLGMKYCSKKCSIRYSQRGRDKRLIDLYKRNGEIDKDITLSKLILRDKNVCHICGKKCDRTDYAITKQGHFKVGKSYPSIDHLMPKSKGGTHTWGNIKLAHMKCNSRKRDKIVYREGNGQLKMIGY